MEEQNNKLKFIALSGTVSVTENLYIYEHGDEMVILDCGVGFPDIEMYGVDLVIPDFTYILKNQHKLKGIVISQGHEDHIGAVPFLLNELKNPGKIEIWVAPLVNEFLQDKFEEFEIKGVKVNIFNPDTDIFSVGKFTFNPFRVTHSVPDSCGFAIDTPQGRVFHVPEHKMDQNPVDNMPFDRSKAERLASEKEVLFLASDCIGANKDGFTENERPIEQNIEKVARNAKKAIYFTAISSNIGRFQQAINVAERLGKKVCFVGRSVQRKCELANKLGYLKYKRDTVVNLREAQKKNLQDIMYLIAGCYGQVGSSLFRIATGDHNRLTIDEGDMVIFSADPAPPYTKESEDFVIDNLIDMGVDVHYYDLDEGLYVSGHGKKGDITELFKITKPKYFLPIGGTVRFMHAYKKLVSECCGNEDQVFMLKPGDVLEFFDGKVNRGKSIPVKEVLVDGHGIGDVGKIVLSDRKTLSEHGVVIVIVKIDVKSGKIRKDPEIVSRGFVFEREEKQFLMTSAKSLKNYLNKKGKVDRRSAKFLTVDFLNEHFFKETARRPMVIPVIFQE
ncbi:ribonuclease J [Candidatus Woesebacteria bacterium]|nr:ribonuclease J [Candidatus Woesebacteria bacterium]